jgi:tripartite-type tricarboxylate transporter receptor subunit TctC
MLIDTMVVLLPMVKSGAVKAIAVTTENRNRAAPNIPTAAESGVPGLDLVVWYGMWGPKGMPADVVASLSAGASGALHELGAAGRLADLGIEATSGTALAKFQASRVDRADALLKNAKFKPQ